ncbi:hypothetical protein L249_6517 [Ophiocordyceps polyrhachis-furcata BCC 54312]|uniref:Histone chaperone domain-containing protein n=1 Tax=Ophiocordyceps polyrhachis-furcata BCC 54312 TaxID=1330021 RepID=A0A367LK45_9HYPO|nr:hypothetical protein L249_6517 [Ophiocordyceps polyrhachis-furcata BCC 54312]
MSAESDYVSRQGDKSEIPVQADDARVDDPIDEDTADTDAQLGRSSILRIIGHALKLTLTKARDEKDAIDTSNIIKEKTRHAAPKGGYREPGDDEGIPIDE